MRRVALRSPHLGKYECQHLCRTSFQEILCSGGWVPENKTLRRFRSQKIPASAGMISGNQASGPWRSRNPQIRSFGFRETQSFELGSGEIQRSGGLAFSTIQSKEALDSRKTACRKLGIQVMQAFESLDSGKSNSVP